MKDNNYINTERFKNLRKMMVKEQIISRGIKDKKVLDAFCKVPRHEFVGESNKNIAYTDRPLPIGMGQTISQPYIVALMTESLELSGNEKVLEIGTGSGYQTAILAEIVRKVYSIEIIPSLSEMAKKSLFKYSNIILGIHDGHSGWKKYSPYDRIIVTAAPDYIPKPLINQLVDGGIMVLPEGPTGWNQVLWKIIRHGAKTKKIRICDVAFVPLTRNLNRNEF